MEAVLFVNDAFYLAFAHQDVQAMEAVWARTLPVACIHPGWGVLTDRAAVMESWRRILTAGRSPEIRCREPKVFLLNGTAFVTCFEEVAGGYLIATNIFAREEGDWRMVHHQAGPTVARPVATAAADEAPLH